MNSLVDANTAIDRASVLNGILDAMAQGHTLNEIQHTYFQGPASHLPSVQGVQPRVASQLATGNIQVQYEWRRAAAPIEPYSLSSNRGQRSLPPSSPIPCKGHRTAARLGLRVPRRKACANPPRRQLCPSKFGGGLCGGKAHSGRFPHHAVKAWGRWAGQ